jgi:hypothetical protein
MRAQTACSRAVPRSHRCSETLAQAIHSYMQHCTHEHQPCDGHILAITAHDNRTALPATIGTVQISALHALLCGCTQRPAEAASSAKRRPHARRQDQPPLQPAIAPSTPYTRLSMQQPTRPGCMAQYNDSRLACIGCGELHCSPSTLVIQPGHGKHIFSRQADAATALCLSSVPCCQLTDALLPSLRVPQMSWDVHVQRCACMSRIHTNDWLAQQLCSQLNNMYQTETCNAGML